MFSKDAFINTVTVDSLLRYAPTPSGFLHAGNACNFLISRQIADITGGKMLLRIDDLDSDRKKPAFVDDIFESLKWLGLGWDFGPENANDFELKWSQHHRIGLYESLLNQLRQTNLLFACQKSRTDLLPYGGKYPPAFRNQGLDLDTPDVAWRIQTPAGFPLSDFIVRRKDGIPAYQVASLADDLYFGVTHIVRGEDLKASTLAQRYLATCVGAEKFLNIGVLHHALIKEKSGDKLSKSAGADSLQAMRLAGVDGLVFQEKLAKRTRELISYTL